jgi:hypothetical protein
MVGDEQGPGHSVRQVGLDLYAERVEKRRRPAGLERQPLAIAAQWEDAQRKNCPADNQQGNAENPESADRDVGLAQSSCPR